MRVAAGADSSALPARTSGKVFTRGIDRARAGGGVLSHSTHSVLTSPGIKGA